MTRARATVVVVAVLVLVAVLALGAGCTTSGKGRPELLVEAEMVGDVQKATLFLHSFYFEPNRIAVRAGVPVELTLQSKATLIPHNFTLRAAEAGIDVSQDVGARKSRVIRFIASRAGEYLFVCGKGSHMAKGMTGVLVVRE